MKYTYWSAFHSIVIVVVNLSFLFQTPWLLIDITAFTQLASTPLCYHGYKNIKSFLQIVSFNGLWNINVKSEKFGIWFDMKLILPVFNFYAWSKLMVVRIDFRRRWECTWARRLHCGAPDLYQTTPIQVLLLLMDKLLIKHIEEIYSI